MNNMASIISLPYIIDKIIQYQVTRDNDIATELLVYYKPIVARAARKISLNQHEMYEDLFQVGQMSMLQLFNQFDCSKGSSFEAYAMKSLIGYLKNYLRDKAWYIQVPRRVKEKGLLVKRAIDELTVHLERSPTICDIATNLKFTQEETIEALACREYYLNISLDNPLSTEANSGTRGDIVWAGADEFDKIDKRLDLEDALTKLKNEEKKVLILVYNEGQSQYSIAKQLGISQMSVSRIRKGAIGKMRNLLGGSRIAMES